MTNPDYKKLQEKILLLETRLKHLTNELRLTKQEYEAATKNYFGIHSHIERNVEKRTRELKRLQKTLQTKGQELELMLDYSPGIIFFKDVNLRYIRVNRKFSKVFGISIEKVVGKTDSELFPGNKNDILKDDLKIIETGEPIYSRERIIVTPKREIPVLIDKVPYKDINGKVIGIIGFALDLSNLKKAEREKHDLQERLARARKMESLGLLGGWVAHDLNNILSGLVTVPQLAEMQIDMMLEALEKESPLRKQLSGIKKTIESIRNSGKRAANIVQDLLTMARRGVATMETLNLNDIVKKQLSSPEFYSLETLIPKVRFETNLASGLLNIRGSEVHLSKSLLNILTNAIEAMPQGGKVTITTTNQYIDKPIKGYENVQEGDYAVLTVADNGIGISAEDLQKIFEPFYTSKVMGRSGTGLGMSVVWGAVKDHKGYIDVDSVEGEGTTFNLYFPVTREEVEKEKAVISIEGFKGHGETILVVDDVEEQREIASQILTALGYNVKAVSSGEEAIEYLRKNSADLLVLDMIMDPGIDGLDTYKCILEIHPGQKSIIASGFAETDRVKKAQRLGVGAYVKKPYTLEKLGIVIREELDKK